MSNKNFTTSILVSGTPHEVFQILTDVRGWWSGLYGEEIEGVSEKPGDTFSFRAGGGAHYSRQQLVELVPDKRLVWKVTDSNLSFLKQPDEWTGTTIGFDLSEQDGKTRLTFTHTGLTPDMECYDSCAPAWTRYMERLEQQAH